MDDFVQSTACTRIDRAGRRTEDTVLLMREHLLSAVLPGGRTLRFQCTDENLRELVVGHLLSEGILSCGEEFLDCAFSPDHSAAEVTLAAPLKTAEPLYPLPEAEVEIPSVFAALQLLKQGFETYRAVPFAHSCQLWCGGAFVRAFEDIGRRNAIDKAIGFAALQKLPMQDCFLFASCRVTSDIVEKAVRSRIPVLAGKAMPSGHAVDVARRYGLRLIWCKGPDLLRVFS